MKITIHEEEGQKMAQVVGDSIVIKNERDALDLMVAIAGRAENNH